MLACLTAPHLERPINLERALKIIIVHDLIEAIVGDVPYTEVGARQENKTKNEHAAIDQLVTTLPAPAAEETKELWFEYENLTTPEAHFVKALDNLEVQMQHNLAPLDTWEPIEYSLIYTDKMHRRCEHESFLLTLADAVKIQGETKLQAGGIDTVAVRASVRS